MSRRKHIRKIFENRTVCVIHYKKYFFKSLPSSAPVLPFVKPRSFFHERLLVHNVVSTLMVTKAQAVTYKGDLQGCH
jgi:hypothetical protein